MAFYIVVQVKGPSIAGSAGYVAQEMAVKDTTTGIVKSYHVEVGEGSADSVDAWLQTLQDDHDLTPNDFGLE